MFDIATGIVTALAELLGLSTWKRQQQFEIARALARCTYTLRDSLQASRAPFLDAREFPSTYKATGADAQKAESYAHVYENRWKPVLAALDQFDAAAREAETLFGAPVREAAQKLRQVVIEVHVAVEALISNFASGGMDFSSDREFARQVWAAVSATAGTEGNEVNTRLNCAVEEIDDLLRPHLRRGGLLRRVRSLRRSNSAE